MEGFERVLWEGHEEVVREEQDAFMASAVAGAGHSRTAQELTFFLSSASSVRLGTVKRMRP